MVVLMIKKVLIGILLFSNIAFAQDKITFVCTGNTGRSVMAEYLANYTYAFPTHGYSAQSRAVSIDRDEITPEQNADIVMNDISVNISEHRAKAIQQSDIGSSKLILTMTNAHKDKLLQEFPNAKNIHTLAECATGQHTDVFDAYGKDVDFYIKTRDQIQSYIKDIVDNKMVCIN
jgi:protein-tyrosine phosphatase